ncbi:MAG: TIGR00730 family Rossman fold protein [Chloroflexota bacterium]
MKGAEALADVLIKQKIGLVYGGGNVGIMGKIAQSMLDRGGEVIGVIPHALYEREAALKTATEMFVVDTMHERKALMARHSDAFITAPGGLGTLEELFEMWTWSQLLFTNKPLGILNTAGYYDPLLKFVDHQIEEGFVSAENKNLVSVSADPEELISMLNQKFG